MPKATESHTTPVPTALPALPSIFDLSRLGGAFGNAFDRIDVAARGNDPEAERIEIKAGALAAAREAAIKNLILTMPAITLPDVAGQLYAALVTIEEANDDEWPHEARYLLRQFRRVVLSALPVVARVAGVDPDTFGGSDLDLLHKGEFPPELIGTPAQAASPDAELIRLCGRLVEINGEEEALFTKIPDDDERKGPVDVLYEEFEEIKLQLFEIGRPVTRGGAEAVARAAWVNGDRGTDGTPLASYLSDWLRLAACAYLANATGPEIRVDAVVAESSVQSNLTEQALRQLAPVTISSLAAYVEGLASGIMAMASLAGGTMNGAISTICGGLALALEREHPGVALLIVRAGSLATVADNGISVAEYLEKKQAAQAAQATVGGQGMTNSELADRHANRPDASLLRMAREFAKVDAQIQILNELEDPSEAVMDAVASRQYALTDIMIDTPAKTAAGWRAKAEVLDASIRLDVTSPDSEHRLATSLAADLMAGIKPAR